MKRKAIRDEKKEKLITYLLRKTESFTCKTDSVKNWNKREKRRKTEWVNEIKSGKKAKEWEENVSRKIMKWPDDLYTKVCHYGYRFFKTPLP